MIEGYREENFGVIRMIDPPECDYGNGYQKQLLGRGELNNYMSYLRYGYLVGAIGRVPWNILDVGYGDGTFLSLCSQTIKNCYGHELVKDRLPKGCQWVEDITEGYYDVICFYDSLEHFKNIDFIADLHCNYICVDIPNCDYQSDEWFQNWRHRKPDQHVYHFGLNSLSSLLSYHGYKLIAHSYLEDIIRKSGTDVITIIYEKR